MVSKPVLLRVTKLNVLLLHVSDSLDPVKFTVPELWTKFAVPEKESAPPMVSMPEGALMVPLEAVRFPLIVRFPVVLATVAPETVTLPERTAAFGKVTVPDCS